MKASTIARAASIALALLIAACSGMNDADQRAKRADAPYPQPLQG